MSTPNCSKYASLVHIDVVRRHIETTYINRELFVSYLQWQDAIVRLMRHNEATPDDLNVTTEGIHMWQKHPGEGNSTLNVMIRGANLYVFKSTTYDGAYQVSNELRIPKETIQKRMSKLTPGVTVKAEGVTWGFGKGQHITITNFATGASTDDIEEIILGGLPSGTHHDLSWNFTSHKLGDEMSRDEINGVITKFIALLDSS